MSAEIFLKGRVQLCCGDSLHFLKDQPDCRYDSIVTDPPYALVSIVKRFGSPNAAPAKDNGFREQIRPGSPNSGPYVKSSAGFMGQKWDTGETAFAVEFWAEVLRVLKPGGHVVAFGGTRTYHRLACAIEDAGFEIRDQLQWIYGSGFPKSHNVSRGIDRALKAEGSFGGAKSEAHQRYIDKGELRGDRGHEGWQRPWMDDPEAVANAGRVYIPGSSEGTKFEGWGTALKPACEPICLARKPLIGTVAANVLQHGTGAINIDGCRVEGGEVASAGGTRRSGGIMGKSEPLGGWEPTHTGRWPANIILSVPENEYELKPFTSTEQKRELYRWLSENA